MGQDRKKNITDNDEADKAFIRKLLADDKDFVRELVRIGLQEFLEAEMTELLGAEKGERTPMRRGYRSGYYERNFIVRAGKIELRVPQDREGRFSTELFDRYERSEKALVLAMIQMYLEGVATRRVRKITVELCGEEFSKSTVSRLVKRLDAELSAFATRRLEVPYPYLILDARYERVREGGVVRRRAVLVAIGIDWDGRRCVLGVELANRESSSSWSDFLIGLKKRGLHGVEFVATDAHEGLQRAVASTLPTAAWQRCYVHFLRNAVDRLPRKKDDDCLTELRWIYDRRTIKEAQSDVAAWLEKWSDKYPKVCDWVEENIEQTLTFYRLPRAHHKHLRSTNMLERVNEELKRRTHLVRTFPNEAACLRLVTALAVEIHEGWQEGSRYLNMDLLREHKKEVLRVA